MDALDRKLAADKELARQAIIDFLDPKKVRWCPGCGHEVVYARDKWFTGNEVRNAARANLEVGSGTMGLALSELIEEGRIQVRAKDLRIRLRIRRPRSG